MERQIAVIVGDAGCLGIGLEQSLNDLDWRTERRGGMQWQIPAIVFTTALVSGAIVRAPR